MVNWYTFKAEEAVVMCIAGWCTPWHAGSSWNEESSSYSAEYNWQQGHDGSYSAHVRRRHHPLSHLHAYQGRWETVWFCRCTVLMYGCGRTDCSYLDTVLVYGKNCVLHKRSCALLQTRVGEGRQLQPFHSHCYSVLSASNVDLLRCDCTSCM